MYEKIKKVVFRIIPKSMLRSLEGGIRFVISLFYLGNKFECNICGAKLRKWIALEMGEEMCPRCGSLPRSRNLYLLFNKLYKPRQKVLHFSPESAIRKRLSCSEQIEYVSSDYAGEFYADKKYDITHISEPDAVFDMVICYHILEHIPDDMKAMVELFRVLKTGGICLIQTPFKEGDTYEDSSIVSPQKRRTHFGQEDHVRIYSANNLKQRLESVGFMVELEELNRERKNLNGLKQKEMILLAKK